MNFEESSSDLSSAELQHQLTDKLFHNYQQIKQSIRRQQPVDPSNSKTSIRFVQRAIEIEEQKNLQTRIHLTEKQLSKARQNNILLLKKLGEAEEHSEFLKCQMSKIKRQKEEELHSFSQLIQNLKHQLLVLKDNRLASSSKDNMSLQQALDLRQRQTNRLNLKVISLQLSLQQKETLLKTASIKIDQLTLKAHQAEARSPVFAFDESSQGSQIIQLQQSRVAIRRLLHLLKSTEEYQNFCKFADYEELFFLQNIIKGSSEKDLTFNRRVRCKCSHQKIDQKLLWCSATGYKALQKIKRKYEALNQVCIEEILFEFNCLWHASEQKIMIRQRQQFKSELQKQKKKNFQRYDELVARKQIERLKRQLQQSRFAKKSPHEELVLLKQLGGHQDQLRLKQKQIRLLNERINIMDSENVNYDRVLYLEGALWLLDKVLDQTSYFHEEIRIKESKMQAQDELDSCEVVRNCFESFEQMFNCLIERLLEMKETTLKKVGNEKRETGDQ